jgi:hypothetical protein
MGFEMVRKRENVPSSLGFPQANCLPFSQANQGATGNVDGRKTKTDGAVAAKTAGEAVTSGQEGRARG